MERSESEAEAGAKFPQTLRTELSFASEIVNPFEALEVVFDEPQMLFAFLVILAAIVLILCIVASAWSGLQELLFGGVPPHGLGLK
ncbi:MAG TPA: hypothetical protein VJW20_11480 [Candidatus Angelobacter sp.]|nr:hypothetical protein [Candidatus Angelobacter sp.]